MNKANKCAKQNCDCELGTSDLVEKSGQKYCSQKCADGQSCGHDACPC